MWGIQLLWCLVCSLPTTSSAKEYRLKNYDYPRIKGASWIYDFNPYSNEENPVGELARITLTDTDWPLDMTRGRSHPEGYLKNTCRFVEENGFWNRGDFHRGRNHIFERSCFYRGAKAGGSYHFGTDELSDRGDPGKTKPQGRLDGGLPLPPVIRIGQRIRATADYYENGRFFGVVHYSVYLVGHCSVKVPYGEFNDCLRLRFVVRAGSGIATADEWWARGVGMVKTVVRGSNPCFYALEGFRLNGDRPVVMRDIEVTHPDQEAESSYPEVLFNVELPVIEDIESLVHTELAIRNNGDTVLSDINAKLHDPVVGFRISKPPPARLMPGESAMIGLELQPAMVHDVATWSYTGCEIDIHSNDPDQADIRIGVSATIYRGN